MRTREETAKDKLERMSIPEPNSGCWLWMRAVTQKGYGHVAWGDRVWIASRLAWTAYRGAIPDGMCVCHKCDVPACINPDHLFLGTNADNAEDRDAKGRRKIPTGEANWSWGNAHSVGERNGRALLTEDQVRVIRVRPEGATTIAREFGVNRETVFAIRKRRIWKHVT